ncbi:MAG: 3-deoxy-D-manno-octulosonic acid transferase [Pseudomonadota bacterium]
MSTRRAPAGLIAYQLATRLVTPLSGAVIALRQKRGKEDANHRAERFGKASAGRPQGPLIWVHAASVGEAKAVLPLIEQISVLYPDMYILATTTTVTSALIMKRQLPRMAYHQFVPLDMPRFVDRFMSHWKPELIIFAESEIWPNILMRARQQGSRLALVNGRMSQRSFQRWTRARSVVAHLLAGFDVCLAQSESDAERLGKLGASSVLNTGNIKFDVPAPEANVVEVAAFKRRFGEHPRWAAVSTHPGEEEIVAEVHMHLKQKRPDVRTLIAPRHPERGTEIAAMLSARGLTVAQRSKNSLPPHDAEIFILDTIGELGLVFRQFPVTFMGGSLVRHGGQNPIEPAKLGSAIVHGPHIRNFDEVYSALDVGGGAEMVRGSIQLAQAVGNLIDNPSKARLRADAANAALEPYTGSLDRTMAALGPLLDDIARAYASQGTR